MSLLQLGKNLITDSKKLKSHSLSVCMCVSPSVCMYVSQFQVSLCVCMYACMYVI
jgi:hypothetical protein